MTNHPVARWLLPPFVLILTLLGVGIMVALRPKPERTIPEPVLPLVEVFPVSWGEVPLAVMAQGTVRPHRETQLMAEVAGRITRVSPQFREGATFAAGNVLVEIDPTDFEAALAQARQQLAQAELTLAQEVNQARQAREDWQRLGGQAETDPLVLREPQLAVAEAAVASAQAAVRVAERNLARTTVRAPFDGRVREQVAEEGQFVAGGGMTRLGSVYATDRFEVHFPLSADEYRRLAVEHLDAGDSVPVVVRATDGSGQEWAGKLLRATGIFDPQTHLTNVVVEIPQAAVADEPAPRPGQFVRASLPGRVLTEAVRLPRAALQPDGGVFVVDADNRLLHRVVEIVAKSADFIVIGEGLADGERVSLTPMLTFIDGMPVEPVPATLQP